jgi:predicted permease
MSISNLVISIIVLITSNILAKRINIDKVINIGNKIITNVLLPMLIIGSFNRINLTSQLVLPLINIVWILIIALIAIVSCKLLKYDRRKSGSLILSSCTSEGGSIGVALIMIIQNGKYIAEFIILDIANAIMLFTFVYYLACTYGVDKKFKSSVLKDFLFSPIILSLIIAVILNLNGVLLSNNINNVINFSAQAILPLILIGIGAKFRLKTNKIVFASIFSIVKIFVGLLIAMLLIKVFGITSQSQAAAIYIISMLPPSYLITVFIKDNNLEESFINNILPLSTIISILVISCIYII